MAWDLQLKVAQDGPLYVAIADAIRRDVLRGRLRPGRRLPGARSLAATLGVHRNTVTAAYDELEQQGWVRTERARGRFVVEVPVRPTAEPLAMPRRIPYRLGTAPPPSRTPIEARYDLAGGLPDPRLFPGDALGRAYRRVMRRQGERVLDYGSPFGHPRLRAAIAAMVADTRGLAVTGDDVLITRGSQMALWLVAQALLAPGENVAVEGYGYRPAWDAMRAQGATLHPIPVDDEGLCVERLEKLCRSTPLRAVYLTPHHQYPTTVALSAPRRLALLALARRHRFAVLEDDYDHELHYTGRPLLPLATMDRSGSVIYLGTLSKVLAPGVRIGWVIAPPRLLERLAEWRRVIDRQGDLAVEAAIAELMEEGELQRHVFRMRKVYGARRDAMLDALERHLDGVLSFTVPRGGMSIWAGAEGVDVERWRERALARGVGLRTARDFAFDRRPRPHLRLGFVRCNEGELRSAVSALRKALPRR